MDKQRNKELIMCAEKVLRASKKETYSLFKDKGLGNKILKSYNGQVAALGVSILMTGLKPTLAIYYQDAPDSKAPKPNTAYRRFVLEIIARILKEDNREYAYDSAEKLVRDVLEMKDDSGLTRNIIDCSVALKQVIRTYKFAESHEE